MTFDLDYEIARVNRHPGAWARSRMSAEGLQLIISDGYADSRRGRSWGATVPPRAGSGSMRAAWMTLRRKWERSRGLRLLEGGK